MNFLQRTSANSLDGRDGGAGRWTGHPDGQQPRPAARLPHSRQGRSPRHQIPTPWQVGPQGGQVRIFYVSFYVFSFVDRGWPAFWFLLGKYLRTIIGVSYKNMKSSKVKHS